MQSPAASGPNDSAFSKTSSRLRSGVGSATTFVVSVVGILLLAVPGSHADPKRAKVAVATESHAATREALKILDAGGNAIDAIVCAALVSGVVSPSSSGLGGGGFALVWRAAERAPFLLDFRETAPATLDAAAFERRPFKAEERGRAVGVPGELAGLYELEKSFGKRSWRSVVTPAMNYANDGFPVSQQLGFVLAQPGMRVALGDPGIAAVFFPRALPARADTPIKNLKLGRTLQRVANEGPRALYTGEIARDLVDSAARAGSALSLEDLTNFHPLRREALHVAWEGYDIYTMPPPSGGGLMLAELLGLFSKQELERLGYGSGAYRHLVAEAMRGALADRTRVLGDPEFTQVDVPSLLSPSRLAARKRRISIDRTHAIPRFTDEEHGTHHLVVLDQEGNAVSLTTTVNSAFGAKLSGARSGIVLNDELDDFSLQKSMLPFGLNESPNRPRAGARPASSMTPTIVVRDGKVVLAIGGSGGPTIATNVTQLLLDRLVFDRSVSELVEAPRFYLPPAGPSLWFDPGVPQATLEDLAWRGEVLAEMPFKSSAVQMIAVDEQGASAAADPRKHGGATAR